MNKLSRKDLLLVSLMLFSLFFNSTFQRRYLRNADSQFLEKEKQMPFSFMKSPLNGSYKKKRLTTPPCCIECFQNCQMDFKR